MRVRTLIAGLITLPLSLLAADTSSYVQDGLVFQLDAIDNAGRNHHDSSVTTWKDLIGSRDGTISGTTVWGEKALVIYGKTGDGTSQDAAKGRVMFDGTLTAAHTIEICCKVLAGQNGGLFFGGGTTTTTFPQLALSNTAGSNPAQCCLRLQGYGLSAEVKDARANFNFTCGETISYSQTGNRLDGVDYFYNGNFYWKHTGISTTCANVGATASIACSLVGKLGIDVEVYAVRIYDRVLTEAERERNARVDQERYLRDGMIEVAGTSYIDWENGNDANDGREYRNPVTGETTTNAMKSFSAYYANIKSRDSDIVFMPGVHQVTNEVRVISGGVSGVVMRGLTGDPKDVVLVGNGTRFFFRSTSQSTNTTISSMTFRNFSTTADAKHGGAIYIAPGANVTDDSVVTNCVFENCVAPASGGAVYYSGRGGRIVDCVFDRCSCGGSDGGGGGGLYIHPQNNHYDPTVVKGCVFKDNFTTNLGIVAAGGGGGGAMIYTRDCICDVIVEDCLFLRNHTLSGILNSLNASNNFTSCGGGLYGNVTRMSNCRFEGNWTDSTDPGSKTNAPGGAWNAMSYGFDGMHTVVENCQFITNFAHGMSGAFHLHPYKARDYGVIFSNCVFTGNSSTGNGAVSYLQWTGGGIRFVHFYDCLFNKNVAPAIGDAQGSAYVSTQNVKSSDILNLISCASDYVRCRFEDNIGYGRSAGIVIRDTDNNKGSHGPGGYRIEDCIFRRNVIAIPPVARQTAKSGGAVWVSGGNGTTNVVIRNCLFESNINSNYLGGSVVFTYASTVFKECAVENCTFVNNQANYDGSLSTTAAPFGPVTFDAAAPVDSPIRNCIFAGNHRLGDPTCVRDIGYYTKSSFTNCLFESASDPSGHGGIKLADGLQGCRVWVDPRFQNAANGDFRLTRTSPALDAGIDQPWMFTPTAHDLSLTNRHGIISRRVVGEHVDLGCYEYLPVGGFFLIVK